MRTKSFRRTRVDLYMPSTDSSVFFCLSLSLGVCWCVGGQKLLRTHGSLIKCQVSRVYLWRWFFCFDSFRIRGIFLRCLRAFFTRVVVPCLQQNCTIVSSASPFGLTLSPRDTTCARLRFLLLIFLFFLLLLLLLLPLLCVCTHCLDWYQRQQ